MGRTRAGARRALARRAGVEIDFHEADVYAAVSVLGVGAFDLVYTGIGALCWLPDVARWARVVADLLRPGGRLFLREGHPMIWALESDRSPGAAGPRLCYPYFEHGGVTVFQGGGTYVTTDATFTATVSHEWNHGLGEIVTGLLDAGMRLTQLVEHDSVPWDALPGHMVEDEQGEWRLGDHPERLAATYTLQAVKE